MTLLSVSWLGRFFSARTRLVAQDQRGEEPPMKITVERLPDYYWRDLGFPLPARDEDRQAPEGPPNLRDLRW